MYPPPQELETFAELLDRWRTVTGPVERVRVVAEASQALRSLSSAGSRVLAQGLVEHGAPAAAQQVAQHAGVAVSPDDLSDVAETLLAVDADHLQRFAAELRDPEERRRLLAQAVTTIDGSGGGGQVPPPEDDEPPPPPDVPSLADTVSEAALPPTERRDGAQAPAGAVAAGVVPTVPPARPRRGRAEQDHVSRLTRDLRAGPTARDRLRRIDSFAGALGTDRELRRVLAAVPDGWQRRTVLRRLVAARRIAALADAGAVVATFARRSDRFTVAALLVRADLATIDDVLPAVDPRDRGRLRQRSRMFAGTRPE